MAIRVLPQSLINKIAAGEVVVRMASVVKELVENSIDAGSTRIEVTVSNEARDLEVRDDGCGMDREDAELCLQRHATSKISSVDDLFALHTRGFRGEAIPSIASVSRMEIQTRPRAQDSGTRLLVTGGRIERIEAFGCPPGTRLIIRDLFFNTPARRKFLKSLTSEVNAIIGTVTRQALAQPHIGFRIERDGREVLDLPAGLTLSDRIRTLFGAQITRPLLAMDFEEGGVRVTGFLAHPHDSRGDRRAQYLFVNERPFSSKPLASALEQACRGFVMASRFPIFCAFVSLPPEEVDFNVHPTKEEVRFRDERFVAGRVFHAAKHALEGSESLIGSVRLSGGGDEPAAPVRQEGGTVAARTFDDRPPGFFTSPEQYVRRAFDRKQARQTDLLVEAQRAASPAPAPVPERAALPRIISSRHRDGSVIAASPGERPDPGFWERGFDAEPLGQVALTYVVARYGDGLLLVDQHAAHERLVYLKLARRKTQADSQPQLLPITLELPPAQSETLRAMLPEMAALGFTIEEFGPRTWAVTSLPADLPEFDPVPMLMELIDDLREARSISALDDLRDRILIRAACHGAIRAGQQLSMQEMRELLRQVQAERLSLTCPHGRPTIVRLPKSELDRQFKRIV